MGYINFGTQHDLNVLQNNDVTIPFSISAGHGPYDLTSLTLTFYLKASATAPDGGAITITPAVVAATLGQMTVAIPHADVATTATMFYHLDAQTSGSLITTLAFGAVNITPI